MVHFKETLITFSEIPDEICLCINIAGCSHCCPGCHSPWLWADEGEDLTIDKLDELIANTPGISCVCFMGDGSDKDMLSLLASHVKNTYTDLKTAIYSGGKTIYSSYIGVFDYIKVGPYVEELGPLSSKTTNQVMYKITKLDSGNSSYNLEDITYKFWNKDIE